MTDPLRILFVTDFYHPYSGGVEIHVRSIGNELAERGHTVAVATLDTPEGEQSRTNDGPVQVFTVGHSAERIGVGFTHANRPWAPPFPDPMTMRGLRQVVNEFAPDVIHGHDWLSRSVLPRWVSGSIPIFTSLHYYTRTCAKKTLWRDNKPCPGPSLTQCLRCAGQHYGSVKAPIVTLGLRAGAKLEDRRSRRYISVSAATEAGNGLAGNPMSSVIMNPVPVPTTSADPAIPPDIPDGPFILFVGDIRPEKGLDVLAEAIGVLRDRYANTTPLVVVGERMSAAIDLPANTIETGLLDNDVVQALWAKATVGVIPSQWPEPFGLVAIEAIAGGCPVVASDIGGLSEIFADGCAELVEPSDPGAFAKAIDTLLSDPEHRRRLSERATATLPRYSVATIVDQLERCYRGETIR